jgi:hypothetical protein
LELNSYLVLISLVEKLGDALPDQIVTFKEQIVGKAIPKKDADVILTTSHQCIDD